MNRINPFIDQRREQENYYSPIYISQNNDFSSWVSLKNYLFVGLRGSGKTSILNVFNYELAWLNPSSVIYHEELSEYSKKQPNYIGVIYKAERQEKSNWQEWEIRYGKSNAQKLYITYLTYYFSGKFVEALCRLKSQFKELDIEEDNEIKLIDTILREAFPFSNSRPKLTDYSLIALTYKLSEIHNQIRQSVISMESFDSIKKYIIFSEGPEKIINICRQIKENTKALSDKLFFALIDDVNRLTEWQLECVNSLIANSDDPLSFKISSVFGLYHTKNKIDGRALGDRDLLTYQLNTDVDLTKISKSKNLDDILHAIFNIRVKKVFPDLKTNIFMKDVFGDTIDIDSSFERMASSSENSKFRKFYFAYKQQKEAGVYKYITDYWLDINNVSIEKDTEALKLKDSDPILYARKRESEVYKKRRQTTVFSIIDYYNLGDKFPYSSFSLIKHITCGSVSEFLRICERLWPEIEQYLEKSIENKTLTPIAVEKQANAIISISDRVYEGIDEKVLRGNNNVSCKIICDRLSMLFNKFIKLESIRKTTECLSLKINEKLPIDIENIIEEIVLFEAFIKLQEGDSFKIGLHPILSPHFNLPYRSPFYYSQNISIEIFRKLILGNNDEANRVIERIFMERAGELPGNLFNQLEDVE
jgi:hypothetical protein